LPNTYIQIPHIRSAENLAGKTRLKADSAHVQIKRGVEDFLFRSIFKEF
jgi:hypothetical protein